MKNERLANTTKTSSKTPTAETETGTTVSCSCLPLSNKKSMKKLRLVFSKFLCTSIKEEEAEEEHVHVRTTPRCVLPPSTPAKPSCSSLETSTQKSTPSDHCSSHDEDERSETDLSHLKVSSHGEEEKESAIVKAVSPRGVMDVHAIEGSDDLKSLAVKSLCSGSYSDSDTDSYAPSCLTIESTSPKRLSNDDGERSEFTSETDDPLLALKEVSRPMNAPEPKKLDFSAAPPPPPPAESVKLPPFVENIQYSFSNLRGLYTGPALHGRIPHGGMGRVEFENGIIYEGNVRKGKLHGHHGVMKTQMDGSIFYKGSFENDKYHGHGEQYQNDVLIYSGNFVNGVREGFGRSYNPDGSLQHEGQFERGKPAHAYFPFQGDEASILSSGQLASDMSYASSVAPVASRYDPTRTAICNFTGDEDSSYMSNSAVSDMTGLSDDENSMMDYSKSYLSRIGLANSSKVKESNDPSSLYSSAVRFMI